MSLHEIRQKRELILSVAAAAAQSDERGDARRFQTVMGNTAGRRLTWKHFTGKDRTDLGSTSLSRCRCGKDAEKAPVSFAGE